MTEYRVDCQECDVVLTFDNENTAVGAIFGHGLASGHNDIEKTEVDDDDNRNA